MVSSVMYSRGCPSAPEPPSHTASRPSTCHRVRHTHRDTQRHTDSERETVRERQWETDRERQTEKERQTVRDRDRDREGGVSVCVCQCATRQLHPTPRITSPHRCTNWELGTDSGTHSLTCTFTHPHLYLTHWLTHLDDRHLLDACLGVTEPAGIALNDRAHRES